MKKNIKEGNIELISYLTEENKNREYIKYREKKEKRKYIIQIIYNRENIEQRKYRIQKIKNKENIEQRKYRVKEKNRISDQ